jgi:hypothetical protein
MPFTSIDDMFERLHITPADGWEECSQWKEGEGEDAEDEELEGNRFFGTDEDDERQQ